MNERYHLNDVLHESGHYVVGKRLIGDCLGVEFGIQNLYKSPYTDFSPNKIITPASSSLINSIWELASADCGNQEEREKAIENGGQLSPHESENACKILLYLRAGDLVYDALKIDTAVRQNSDALGSDLRKIQHILTKHPYLKNRYRAMEEHAQIAFTTAFTPVVAQWKESHSRMGLLKSLDKIEQDFPSEIT